MKSDVVATRELAPDLALCLLALLVVGEPPLRQRGLVAVAPQGCDPDTILAALHLDLDEEGVGVGGLGELAFAFRDLVPEVWI